MSKFIGTIIDKSYYQIYQRIKGNKIFYYCICPFCEEELDEGSSALDGGRRTAVLPHNCKSMWGNVIPLSNWQYAVPRKIRMEWGQFYFKEANDEDCSISKNS